MTTEEKRTAIRERLDAMGIACAQDAAGKLAGYHSLLEEWNARFNLTGDAAFDAMLDRHLMDSLAPLTAGGLLPANAFLVDVGSGAGMPGIPLAIARPDLAVTLLDSQKKRIGFLNAVKDALGLHNVIAVHARAEDAARDARYREQFDAALARAVAALPILMELLLPFVRVGGRVVAYKGPSAEDELAAGKAAAALLGGGPLRTIPVSMPFLPDCRHCLVVSEKQEHTPQRYPRQAGTPAKHPLGI